MSESEAPAAFGAGRILHRVKRARPLGDQPTTKVSESVEARPTGPIAQIEGVPAVAAGGLALFAPLAISLLSMVGAPSWTYIVALAAAAPLVAAISAALIRPQRPTLFALAMLPLACGAAWFAWASGGPASPAAAWVFAAIAGVALMGGRRGALFAALLAIGFGALFLSVGKSSFRLTLATNRDELQLLTVLSWSFALFGLAASTWAALTAWTNALPALRRPTVAARRALSLLTDDGAVAGLRISPAGVVVQALGAPERALSLPRDELRGIDVKTLAHPDDLPQVLEMLNAAHKVSRKKSSRSTDDAETRAEEHTPALPDRSSPLDPKTNPSQSSATIRMRSRSGAFEWVEVSAAPAEPYPRPSRVGAAASDALLIVRARWRAANSIASDDRSRDTAFLAQVNTDLRSSIKSIHGYTEILSNEIFGPLGGERYREYARLAHTDAQKLLSLVDELLDLAEIEAGRFVAAAELIDPVPLIDGAVRNLSQTAERLGIALSADFPPNAPYIRVDRRALRRALSGLALDGLRRAQIGDQVVLKIDVEDGALRFAVVVKTSSVAPSPSAQLKLAAPSHPSGAPGAPPAAASEQDADRESVRAAARLSRIVARSLVERMNGAILIAPDNERPTPDSPLIAAEAIFETPRSVSSGEVKERQRRLLPSIGADPVSFAPEDDEAKEAAERARAAAEADAARVQQPLFSTGDAAEKPEEPQADESAAPKPERKVSDRAKASGG